MSVRNTVTPIVGQIQNGEVDTEDGCRPRSECRDQSRKRRRHNAVDMEKSIQGLAQPIKFKVGDERKQNDADEKCIGYIGSDRVSSRPTGERPEPLERSTDDKADG